MSRPASGRLVSGLSRFAAAGAVGVISFPVVSADYDSERYLVSMLGDRADWVRNVHAPSGRAVLSHGQGRRRRYGVGKVRPAEPFLTAPRWARSRGAGIMQTVQSEMGAARRPVIDLGAMRMRKSFDPVHGCAARCRSSPS